MKRIEWLLSLGLMMLALFAGNVYAQSPREEFRQMVEQLQKSPNDIALREKIIKLAQELKPAPAVPEEAIRHEGRGKFAFKNAKSPEDYLDAAKEYEQAANVAPWVSGYYSDLCTIHEKTGNYAEGKRNCELYLKTVTDLMQIADMKERIAGLEYAIEKESKREKAKQNTAEKLVGVWAIGKGVKDDGPARLEGTIMATWNLRQAGQNQLAITPFMTLKFDAKRKVTYTAPAEDNNYFRFDGTVDGTSIRGKILLFGYICPAHQYEAQGEVLRDGQAIKLQFYQEYDHMPVGAEGRCGRMDMNTTIYLYRQ